MKSRRYPKADTSFSSRYDPYTGEIYPVTPAKAGVQARSELNLDSRFRGNDKRKKYRLRKRMSREYLN